MGPASKEDVLLARLSASVIAITEAQQRQVALIHRARDAGITWDQIADALGCTRAWAQRLAKRDRPPDDTSPEEPIPA